MPRETPGRGGDPLGADYWALAAYGALALALLLLTAGALPADPLPEPPVSHDAEVRALAHHRTVELQRWNRSLARLCRDPELLAAELAPDCTTGTITLPSDELFDASGAIAEDRKAELRRGVPVLLERLRADPAVWRELDVIEVQGHSDPRALRDRYATNLVASHQRALAVLLFLTTDPDIPEPDRLELQRLAVASGASYSRPPQGCLVRSPDCDDRSRRVELRLGVDATALRAGLGRFYDDLGRVISTDNRDENPTTTTDR